MPRIERSLLDARVSENWLQRYLKCTGAKGWPATRLPPLVLQIAAAPLHMSIMADRAFPFRPFGIVHQSQRIEQWRTLNASASYDFRVFTSETREERRGISFGLITEAKQEGTLVWRSDVRILSLSRAPVKSGHTSRSRDELAEPTPSYCESIFVPEPTGRDYARIASDYNPVHIHAWLARPFGFRRAIAHGTWTLARALFLTGLPASPRYLLEARFLRPVDLPSTIVVSSSRGSIESERCLLVSSNVGNHPLISASIRSDHV